MVLQADLDRHSGVLDALRGYGYTGTMKATVDIPDPLYRQVKARAALEGRAVREVTIELYERWLSEGTVTTTAEREAAAAAWIERWERLGAEITERAVDPRTTREILLADRR